MPGSDQISKFNMTCFVFITGNVADSSSNKSDNPQGNEGIFTFGIYNRAYVPESIEHRALNHNISPGQRRLEPRWNLN